MENSSAPLTNPQQKSDDERIVKMWTPYRITVDENYPFIPKHRGFDRFTDVMKFIVNPILLAINKIGFGYRAEGRENAEAMKGRGCVTVCNHVNIMDCTMVFTAVGRKDIVFPTIKENFEIPVIRFILKGLGAVPIPQGLRGMSEFSKAVEIRLKEGRAVHFYPEGVLFPYYNGLRKFRRGAFSYAVKGNVPVMPMVLTYHKPKSRLRKKPEAHIHILPAIYPDEKLPERERISDLRRRVSDAMQNAFDAADCLRDNTEVLSRLGKN